MYYIKKASSSFLCFVVCFTILSSGLMNTTAEAEQGGFLDFIFSFASQVTETNSSTSATTSELNALHAAHDYLESMPFSYSGLIAQLEYEGFSQKDATYAAENCGADWQEQALLCAISYIDSMPFSHKGLIEQLEYEGFTRDDATYAVENCGADWQEQAVACAYSYQEALSLSYEEMIDQLEYDGFTLEHAVFAANCCYGKSNEQAPLMETQIAEANLDKFSVRNGIQMGMTVDEVKRIEGHEDFLHGDWTGEKYHTSLRYWYLPIATIEGSSLEYKFNDDARLYEIAYTFGSDGNHIKKNHAENNYNLLLESLLEKYGSPLYQDVGSLSPFVSDEFSSWINTSKMMKIFPYRLLHYTEWEIEFQDTWIVIDLFCTQDDDRYYCRLAFRAFGNYERDKEIENSKSREEKRRTTINNDI